MYAAHECGSDGYPFVWHEEIKHAIRAAGGNRCARCHHPYMSGAHGNGQWSPCDEQCEHGGPTRLTMETTRSGVVEAEWRILTVHHVNGDKADCRWWNLVPLCQRCHLNIQRRVDPDVPWPWPHTDWFAPYAAGFYAAKYLGEDLTRPEVEARLDELLALELRAEKIF